MNKILEEDLQSIGLDDETRSNYGFDFSFLKKQRRREKLKLIGLSAAIIFLLILIIVLAYSYQSANKKYSDLLEERNTWKLKAGSSTDEKPGFCYTDKTHRLNDESCTCDKKYVRDGNGICRDINFAVEYHKSTTENVPHSRRVIDFPATDTLSICVWYYLTTTPDKWMSIFNYVSYDLQEENVCTLWLTKDSTKVTQMHKDKLVSQPGSLKKWTHFCYTWQSTGEYAVFINGTQEANGTAVEAEFKKPFAKSQGVVLLGQDQDDGKIQQIEQGFNGILTRLFVYSKVLSHAEIIASFNHDPLLTDIILGWWEFKGRSSGNDIVEIEFPF